MNVVSSAGSALRRLDLFLSGKLLVAWLIYSYSKSGFERNAVVSRIPLLSAAASFIVAAGFLALFSVLSVIEPVVSVLARFVRKLFSKQYKVEVIVGGRHVMYAAGLVMFLVWFVFA